MADTTNSGGARTGGTDVPELPSVPIGTDPRPPGPGLASQQRQAAQANRRRVTKAKQARAGNAQPVPKTGPPS